MPEREGYYRSIETRPDEEEEHGAGAGYHHPGYVGEGPEGRMQGRGVEVVPTTVARTHGAGPFRGRGPRGYQRSPERIYEDVCDRLSDDEWLDASDVEVQVHDTTVVLKGKVRDEHERMLAEDLAGETSGVTRVVNELRIT